MKRNILISVLISLTMGLFAQETEDKPIDKPVRDPFASGYLIDNQTTVIQSPKTLEYVIQHRFGNVNNGLTDLFGIYAPGSNIRTGLNYVIAQNLQIGWGITKLNMYNDFNIKYTILEQTRKNSIPVAVGVYANMAIDGRNKSEFGKNYEFSDRLSYFSQLIVGRKFNNWLTLQVATSFTHFNSVDTLLDHDKIGIHFSGRAKISPQGSIIFNYDIPLMIKGLSEYNEFTNHPLPNLAIGAEIATSTHAFHIFIGTANGIIPQEIMMYNHNDYTNMEMSLGFLITRLWNF